MLRSGSCFLEPANISRCGAAFFVGQNVAKQEFDIDLPKLKGVIDNDYKSLEVYRKNLVYHVREFCGSHYSDNGSEGENPVNLISLYIRIISDYLVGSDPRMMVSTFTKQIKPYASTMEDWSNKQLVKMRFADILRTAITDGLFLTGITKTSLTAPAQSRFNGYTKPGDVSISNIAFKDMVFDTRAAKFNQCDYIGHYYDVFYEHVKNSSLFDKVQRKKLVPKDENYTGLTGEEDLADIGRGGSPNHEEYEDKVRLCEVWMRRQNCIVTFDADGDCEKPLMVQKWIGPECGPFDFLSFAEVIGNLMPKGPVLDLIDMHNSFNKLWCKTDNQADRQKKVVAFRNAEDAKRLQDAVDGQWVQADDPKNIAEISTGGADPSVANWAQQTYQMFSEYAGNLKSLGGLGSQSNTATQEKLVHESASNLIQAMGGRVMDFTQRRMEGLCWYWWNSPRQKMNSSYSVPGLPDISIDREVHPLDRLGTPFSDLDIQIDPYSLMRQTPAGRNNEIDSIVLKWILPALPLFNQPGVSDMLAEAIRMKARYTNNPDLITLLEKLLGVGGPPEGQSPPEQAPMPAETTRNYVRESKPGMTDQGHQQVLQQLMAGGQPGGQGAGGLGQMAQGAM